MLKTDSWVKFTLWHLILQFCVLIIQPMWLVSQLRFYFCKKQKSNAFNKRNRFPRLKHSTIQPVSSICVDSGVQRFFFTLYFTFCIYSFFFLEKESGTDEKQQLLLNLWENEIATGLECNIRNKFGTKNLGLRCLTRDSFEWCRLWSWNIHKFQIESVR